MSVDALTGGRAAETVRFALDGAFFEVDLGRRNAAAPRRALAPFVAAAQPVTPGRRDDRR